PAPPVNVEKNGFLQGWKARDAKRWAANGRECVIGQFDRIHIRIAARAVPDRDVHFAAPKIDQLIGCMQAKIDHGQDRLQFGQTRNKPLAHKGGVRGKRYFLQAARLPHAPDRVANRLQRRRRCFMEFGAARRQQNPPWIPVEQLDAQIFFQLSDLVADRRWRHRKFERRALETRMPRHGFERAERSERRKVVHDEFCSSYAENWSIAELKRCA
ncbi:MAG: hypothetical protein V4564_04115, partial [Pseudomonadota bacterium]